MDANSVRPAGTGFRRMVSRSLSLGVAAVVLLAALDRAAFAHHSFTATYFEDRTVTISGTVLQFQFRNPHSFVHVQAADESGAMHRWAVEWGGSAQLSNQGLASATLRPGDVVEITGNPGRDAADHRVRMLYLLRPSDGFDWGNEPGETFD
jgi:Family of unknown function (DUF6152)